MRKSKHSTTSCAPAQEASARPVTGSSVSSFNCCFRRSDEKSARRRSGALRWLRVLHYDAARYCSSWTFATFQARAAEMLAVAGPVPDSTFRVWRLYLVYIGFVDGGVFAAGEKAKVSHTL